MFDNFVLYLVQILDMKPLRTFQSSPQEEDEEVKQLVEVMYTSTCVCRGHGGRPALRGQGTLAGVFLGVGLQSNQVELLLEAAIGCWDHQGKGKMSKHATNHGLRIKTEAYATQDLLMKNSKKEAHNTLRTSHRQQQHGECCECTTGQWGQPGQHPFL